MNPTDAYADPADVVIDGEYEVLPSVPITEPEQIQEEGIKTIALGLVQASSYEPPQVQLYHPAPLPEITDPRSLGRKTLDTVCLKLERIRGIGKAVQKFYGNRTEILRRIETERSIALARAKAEYLQTEEPKIKENCTALRQDYEHLSQWKAGREELLRLAESSLREGEQYLQEFPATLRNLGKELTPESAWYQELKTALGEKGAQQALEEAQKKIPDERKKMRETAGLLQESLEYLRLMKDHYQPVIQAAEESLELLKENLRLARRQLLGVKLSLDTYQGMTVPEMDALQRVQNLQTAQRQTAGLKEEMQNIHDNFEGASTAYQLTAPEQQTPAPLPEHTEMPLLTRGTRQGESL